MLNRIILVLSLSLLFFAVSCDDEEKKIEDWSCVIDESIVAQMPAYDFSALPDVIEAFIAEFDKAEEASLIVVHKDYGPVYEGVFGLHEEGSTSILASTSKMPSAMVAMALADEGLIDMDEPIADYVDWDEKTEFLANDDPRLRITMRHLFSNHSGLPGLYALDMSQECCFLPNELLIECAEFIFTTEPLKDQTASKIIEPGTEFRYGGGQWQVGGGVAEYVSGKQWKELVEEKLVGPAKLQVLMYGNMAQEDLELTKLLTSYPDEIDSPDTAVGVDNPTIEGGAITNIHDYGNLLMVHLNEGMCGANRVLSKQAVEEMRVNYSENDLIEGSPYGMGWWIETNSAGETIYNDSGLYGSRAWLDLNRNIGVFIMLEALTAEGSELMKRIEPIIREAVDAAK